MRLILPPDFLPCIDDAPKLRTMADYIEDYRDGWQAPDCPLDDAERDFLGRLLRWTADEWERPEVVRYDDVGIEWEYRLRWKAGGPVWAEDRGYRRVLVVEINGGSVRTIRSDSHWRHHRQIAESFAWWDLTPYVGGGPRPKRRRGFATETNATLAHWLCQTPEQVSRYQDLSNALGLGPKVLYQPQGEPPEPAPLAGSLFS